MANNSSSSRSSRVIASDPDQPSGKHLYLDKKRRMIYQSPLLHEALYLPRSDYRKFNRYRSRFLVALATFLILSTTFGPWFSLPLWASAAIALLVWAGLEYSFYTFLKTLVPVKNFDPSKAEPTLSQTIPADMRGRCWLKIVLYFALGILLVVNAYQQNYDLTLLLCCWAAMFYCLYTGGRLALAVLRSS